MKHTLFIARTVLVQNNDVEKGIRTLNRILSREGVLSDIRRIQRFEKPWQTRRRINFEHCKAIYHEDLDRKIKFISRKNRKEPFPGC